MKNIKGEYGVINLSGRLGDPSYIIDCRNENFSNYIETGILSTVNALIAKEFFTVSSCQGHPGNYCKRCVSVIDEYNEIINLVNFIGWINMKMQWNPPIYLELLQVQPTMNLYKNHFNNPRILQIIFGDFSEAITIKKQSCFNKVFMQKYQRAQDSDDHSIIEMPYDNYLLTGQHQDVFF